MDALEDNEFKKEPDLAALSAAHALLKTAPERALPMLEELAGRGSLVSMIYLGNAYLRGRGVRVDVEKAKAWLDRATREGSKLAPHQFGLLYWDLKDYQRAEEMFRLSASWNYLPSLYRLGLMFADGMGMALQPKLARDFFERASSQGHVFARRNLAGLLMRGEGGPRNIVKGVWLFVSGLAGVAVLGISDPEGDRMRS
jgi:uncharacterized protein